MIKVLGDALAPIFAGLLLGYFAGPWRRMDNQNVRTMITFVMSFAVPCSMFLTIARTPRAELREQGGAALVLTIVYVVLYALTFVWARSQEKLGASESSVLALRVSFPNSAAVGLALLASVFGAKIPGNGSNVHCSWFDHRFRDHPGDPRSETGPFCRKIFI